MYDENTVSAWGDVGPAETGAKDRPEARARGDAAMPGLTPGAARVLTPECQGDMRGMSTGCGKSGGGDTRGAAVGAAVGTGVGARGGTSNAPDAGACRVNDAREHGWDGEHEDCVLGVAEDGCCCAGASTSTCWSRCALIMTCGTLAEQMGHVTYRWLPTASGMPARCRLAGIKYPARKLQE
eukprot:scaffold8679_cov121-Isochrysis_galbana.AAC.7